MGWRGKSLRTYERYYLAFFLIVLSTLVLSIVQQLNLSQQLPIYSSYDDHRHTHPSIFDKMHTQEYLPPGSLDQVSVTPTQKMCTYWNCIDSYRCVDDGLGKISVYVYDVVQYVDEESRALLPPPSNEYIHILWAIVNSKYIVSDPNQACILIPSIDLLNRENLSGEVAAKLLALLPFWNNGTNHLLFNMIPGIAPQYLSTLDFSHGKSMVTGSGFTQRSYRRTFDISLPLFNPHQKDEDFHNSHNSYRSVFIIAAQRTFYQHIYDLLNNLSTQGSDIVVLTPCVGLMSHGRCDAQGKVRSYPAVLTNSKFCLVTQERQLATIYLHDILRAGCVPVISMDMYIMPFSEVLDWKRAAVFINENRLDELVPILTSLVEDGNAYRQLQEQGQFYYEHYFRSLAQIALTTLDIINDRVLPYRALTYEHWNRRLVPNSPPNPFFVPLMPSQKQGFTAVILTYDRFELMRQVVSIIAKTRGVAKIIIIWNNPELKPPAVDRWPAVNVPVKVIRSKYNRLSNRFYPYDDIETDCVLSIDDDITMVAPGELDFGYRVWAENPDRLVGFPPRFHSLNGSNLMYESEWMSNISMVLTGVAFYHKYYHYLFTSSLPGRLKHWVDENMNCEDIAMNFLIANVTGKAPIKLLARKKFKSTSSGLSSAIISHLVARNVCMRTFMAAFGAMPLRTVEFRADPVLFKQEGYVEHLNMYRSDGEL